MCPCRALWEQPVDIKVSFPHHPSESYPVQHLTVPTRLARTVVQARIRSRTTSNPEPTNTMNESNNIPATTLFNRASSPSTPPTHRSATIKVSFLMDRVLYDEINAALTQITDELGLELTLPKFLKKTVTEGWKLQAERYRKLNAALKR